MRIEKALSFIHKKDPFFSLLLSEYGVIKLQPPKSNFEMLVHAIVSQQLSTKAAAAIFTRVVHVLDYEINPDKIATVSSENLRAAGLSGQKVNYLLALAEAFRQKRNLYKNLHTLENEEIISLLTRINGVGLWTAQMFLIFTLLREDVFPIGDLGVRRGMEKLLFEGVVQSHDTLISRAQIWSPFRSVACLYLWKSLEKKT